jgi:Ala-tRNA(Pro) deacylase
MSTPTWIKKTLNQRGVPYEELSHLPAYTAQEVAQREHFTGHRMAKVVVVVADGRFVELVLPASRRVDFDWVAKLLRAAQVRLATEDEMAEVFADCEVGAIPPLRHWPRVEVVVEASLCEDGPILFQAGTHSEAVRLRFEDWFRVVDPRVESFAEPAPAMA